MKKAIFFLSFIISLANSCISVFFSTSVHGMQKENSSIISDNPDYIALNSLIDLLQIDTDRYRVIQTFGITDIKKNFPVSPKGDRYATFLVSLLNGLLLIQDNNQVHFLPKYRNDIINQSSTFLFLKNNCYIKKIMELENIITDSPISNNIKHLILSIVPSQSTNQTLSTFSEKNMLFFDSVKTMLIDQHKIVENYISQEISDIQSRSATYDVEKKIACLSFLQDRIKTIANYRQGITRLSFDENKKFHSRFPSAMEFTSFEFLMVTTFRCIYHAYKANFLATTLINNYHANASIKKNNDDTVSLWIHGGNISLNQEESEKERKLFELLYKNDSQANMMFKWVKKYAHFSIDIKNYLDDLYPEKSYREISLEKNSRTNLETNTIFFFKLIDFIDEMDYISKDFDNPRFINKNDNHLSFLTENKKIIERGKNLIVQYVNWYKDAGLQEVYPALRFLRNMRYLMKSINKITNENILFKSEPSHSKKRKSHSKKNKTNNTKYKQSKLKALSGNAAINSREELI